MSLEISQVVDVQLIDQAMGAARRDFSLCLLLTPEKGNAFADEKTRYVYASSADEVSTIFGSGSDTHKAAMAFFGVTPRPKKVLIGRWNREAQEITKKPHELQGLPIQTDINFFKEVNAGYFSFDFGGEKVTLENLDFSSSKSYAEVVKVIETALKTTTGVTITYDEVGRRVILSSEGKKIGYAFDDKNSVGYVGRMLMLEDGQASIVKGHEAATVKQETTLAALTEINNQLPIFYGIYVCGQPTDAEADAARAWVDSAKPNKIMAYTALRDDQQEWSDSNVVKGWHERNARVMVQFNKTGDVHAAATLLAESVNTNWAGSNTAKTIKFKTQPTQSDEKITLQEAQKCRRLGMNFYTDYDGIPMVAEGQMVSGRFIDEITGLDAFVDSVQKAVFNYLKAMPKVAQTDIGTSAIMSQIVPVCEMFVRNGFVAGGQWNGQPIGLINTGDYLETGYYLYADSFTEQMQTDREQRLGMPISVAIKLAGAIHQQDIIVNFNR